MWAGRDYQTVRELVAVSKIKREFGRSPRYSWALLASRCNCKVLGIFYRLHRHVKRTLLILLLSGVLAFMAKEAAGDGVLRNSNENEQ